MEKYSEISFKIAKVTNVRKQAIIDFVMSDDALTSGMDCKPESLELLRKHLKEGSPLEWKEDPVYGGEKPIKGWRAISITTPEDWVFSFIYDTKDKKVLEGSIL